jgi:hypothetical protein
VLRHLHDRLDLDRHVEGQRAHSDGAARVTAAGPLSPSLAASLFGIFIIQLLYVTAEHSRQWRQWWKRIRASKT